LPVCLIIGGDIAAHTEVSAAWPMITLPLNTRGAPVTV
jgi:hypothetical protein